MIFPGPLKQVEKIEKRLLTDKERSGCEGGFGEHFCSASNKRFSPMAAAALGQWFAVMSQRIGAQIDGDFVETQLGGNRQPVLCRGKFIKRDRAGRLPASLQQSLNTPYCTRR